MQYQAKAEKPLVSMYEMTQAGQTSNVQGADSAAKESIAAGARDTSVNATHKGYFADSSFLQLMLSLF